MHAVPDPCLLGWQDGGMKHLGILLFDGVEELDAVGPWEVLPHCR